MVICISCGGKLIKGKCSGCGAIGGLYTKGGYQMAKPKVEKKDYVYCPSCKILVAKAKLIKQDDMFQEESDPACPFCNAKVEDLE